MYKFLDLYRKYGKDFIRPEFKWFIGDWYKDPNLPVWRTGNIIYLTKNYRYYKNEWSYAKLIKSEWTDEGKKAHPIISKIFKPVYELPHRLSFYFFNSDIVWKTKWTENDFRYEYPAHITLVLFGFSISLAAYIPQQNEKDFTCNDDYWESLLTYNYYKGDLKKTNDAMGSWNDPKDSNFRFCFQSRFLKDSKKREELEKIQNKKYQDLINKKDDCNI